MAIDRPKILSRFTVPTAWTITVVGELGHAGEASFTADVPAGDYYVSQDNQSDDFLKALCSAVNIAGAATFGGWTLGVDGMYCVINSDHTITIAFEGTYFSAGDGIDIQIRWTQTDGDEIGAVLGFDTSADLTFPSQAYPSSAGDWQHAYAWYAKEDCLLDGLGIEDADVPHAIQDVAPSGHVKTKYVGSRFENTLSLSHVQSAHMFSNGIGYAAASVHPYERNVGLECWWHTTGKRGIEFRVYRNDPLLPANADLVGVGSVMSSTFIRDLDKDWSIDPQEWKDMHSLILWRGTYYMRRYITSNTATQANVSTGEPSGLSGANSTYYLFRATYETYIVDLSSMKMFEPFEIPSIDRHNISIPLVRYA